MSLSDEQERLISFAIDLYYYRDILALKHPTNKSLPIAVELKQDPVNKTIKITLDAGVNIRIKDRPPDQLVFFAVGSSPDIRTWGCYIFKTGMWVQRLTAYAQDYVATYSRTVEFDDSKHFNLEVQEIPGYIGIDLDIND